jgi:pteridine reductase
MATDSSKRRSRIPAPTDGPAPLAGRVVLVTGGARRVGAAIARCLHAAGARVAIHCHRSGADARALKRELGAARPDSAEVVRADLLDLDALPGLVAAVIGRFGRLDALVNNASSFYATPLAGLGVREFDDLIGTNLRAPLFLAKAAAPHLAHARGAIVNLVDIHAERPMPGHLVYSVAKGGLVTLTRGLAIELGPRVRVNAVAPGPVLWPDEPRWAARSLRRSIVERTALKREGSPADIARAVRYLLADAGYVTGQVLAVDGGRSVVL